MTVQSYINVLHYNLNKSSKKLGLKDTLIFQQGNDSKPTAIIMQEWQLYNECK